MALPAAALATRRASGDPPLSREGEEGGGRGTGQCGTGAT